MTTFRSLLATLFTSTLLIQKVYFLLAYELSSKEILHIFFPLRCRFL